MSELYLMATISDRNQSRRFLAFYKEYGISVTFLTLGRGTAAARAERMLPLLTEEELAFYKRGRNAHVHQVPKNATYAQYARATGLECLFGALYLTGQLDRLNELFILTMEESYAI